jgi:hypothetical protein
VNIDLHPVILMTGLSSKTAIEIAAEVRRITHLAVAHRNGEVFVNLHDPNSILGERCRVEVQKALKKNIKVRCVNLNPKRKYAV